MSCINTNRWCRCDLAPPLLHCTGLRLLTSIDTLLLSLHRPPSTKNIRFHPRFCHIRHHQNWYKNSSLQPRLSHATYSHPSAPPIHCSVTYSANQRNPFWLIDWFLLDDISTKEGGIFTLLHRLVVLNFSDHCKSVSAIYLSSRRLFTLCIFCTALLSWFKQI